MSNDKIKENIDKFGWHFLFVFDSEGENVGFAYSVGFEETYNHPEIMIFGLKQDTSHGILSDIAHELSEGKTFESNVKLQDVIGDNLDVIFKPVKDSAFSDYLGTALNYYDKSFRAYVLFWPDKSNILPTEVGCELTVQNEALEIV